MDKKSLRKIIRERKATVNAEEHRQWSAAICNKLLQHHRLIEATTILLFYPLPDEPDIRPLISTLHSQGKRVLLPVVTGPETMELRIYNGENNLVDGALGTQHPNGLLFTDYSQIETAIIPGVAFDRQCNRMGRGKGYYDRFLAKATAYTIGICLPFQLVDEVPVEATDIRMNEVIA